MKIPVRITPSYFEDIMPPVIYEAQVWWETFQLYERIKFAGGDVGVFERHPFPSKLWWVKNSRESPLELWLRQPDRFNVAHIRKERSKAELLALIEAALESPEVIEQGRRIHQHLRSRVHVTNFAIPFRTYDASDETVIRQFKKLRPLAHVNSVKFIEIDDGDPGKANAVYRVAYMDRKKRDVGW